MYLKDAQSGVESMTYEFPPDFLHVSTALLRLRIDS